MYKVTLIAALLALAGYRLSRNPIRTVTATNGEATGVSEPSDAVLPGEKRWNLLVITADTLRADHLGCYGYFRDTSPAIDSLAAESVLFERCLVPMSTTLPSHTSIFTGTWPAEHGILANIDRRLVFERDPTLSTLAQVFLAAGYQTAAFVSAYPLRKDAGLDTGFQIYTDTGEKSQLVAERTTARAVRWIETEREGPFFLWVHYFDPHGPYRPEAPYDSMFETSPELRQWLGERAVALSVHRSKIKRTELGRRVDIIDSTNKYDGEIRYMDQHIGRLLARLDELQLRDNTVIAFIGDHGEGLNQHRDPGHGFSWEEQLRAPLLIRAPGLAPRQVSKLVSAVDLGPTLLELMAVPNRSQFMERAEGVDLLDPEYRERPLLSQSSAKKEITDHRAELALTTPRWKYMRRSDGGVSLFDLKADPFELHDLAVLYPERVQELGSIAESLQSAQRTRGGGATRAATPEEVENLRGLGYGGGDEDD